MMNTKKPHTAKLVQMHPQPVAYTGAIESLFHGLEMIENKLKSHFDQETKSNEQ